MNKKDLLKKIKAKSSKVDYKKLEKSVEISARLEYIKKELCFNNEEIKEEI